MLCIYFYYVFIYYINPKRNTDIILIFSVCYFSITIWDLNKNIEVIIVLYPPKMYAFIWLNIIRNKFKENI